MSLDRELMECAMRLAEEAYENFEVPIGCVIIYPIDNIPYSVDLTDFEQHSSFAIIGRGRNNTMRSRNASRHAEIEAIDQINQTIPFQVVWSECSLYVTVEPCIMCIAALANLGRQSSFLDIGIKEIVFGCHNERFGGCGSTMELPKSYFSSMPLIRSGIMAKEAIILLRRFYIRENKSAPKPRKKENRMLKEP